MDKITLPTLQEFIAFGRNTGFARNNRYYVQMTAPSDLLGMNSDYFRDANMLCEEAAFPGVSIRTRTFRINGLSEQRAHTKDYMGDEINFQFLTDQRWNTRKLFEDWMMACVGGAEDGREVGFYRNYISDIEIYALAPIRTAVPRFLALGFNENDIKNIAYKFIGTTPISNDVKKILGNDKVRGVLDKVGRATGVDKIIDSLGGDDQAEIPVWGIKLREAWPRVLNVQQLSYSQEGYLRLNMTFTFKFWERISIDGDEPKGSSIIDKIEDTVKSRILDKVKVPTIRAIPNIRSAVSDLSSLIPKF